jgi:hypothetical protein
MKERSGTVNEHIPGSADAIYPWWRAETETDITQEDEQYGII